MTVYVDELRRQRASSMRAMRAGLPHNHMWCHLMADTEDELSAMAYQLGLKISWKHEDHYDLTPPRRKRAIELGAKEVTARDLVGLRQRARAQVPSKS